MRKILVLILFSIQLSCGNENKIKSESFNWQPYKIGDKLIFKSNTNQMDTIFIKEISNYTMPSDHLAIFADYNTTYHISGEITLINPFIRSTGKKVTKDYIDILKLSVGRETDYLTLNFKKRNDTLSYSEVTFKISELKSMFENKSEFESIEINTESRNEMPFSYDLKTFFWNKQLGYTKYVFKNGHSWELIEFIRNNKNIFKKQKH